MGRKTIALPEPVYNALREEVPPGMTFYGHLIQALNLDIDPADL